MFSRLFKPKQKQANTQSNLDRLTEALQFLEKKEKLLTKKAVDEFEKAKRFNRANNKRAAMQCLKKKKLYEQQTEKLGDFQLRIHEQMALLESAKATNETVEALRTGASSLTAMQKTMRINDVDRTMEEIHQQSENMNQVQEALSTPIGAAANFDTDDLEAELGNLEDAQPPMRAATTAPAQSLSTRPAHPLPRRQIAEEVDELAALQAELAL